jgi:alginate O-acetyltransferase complex protein AlgI
LFFNSYIFIFLFLPVVLLGFHWFSLLAKSQTAIAWLVVVSLFFYGWWNPAYLGLILGSMLINYGFGVVIIRKTRKVFLVIGIALNLLLLGYFKYANFFIDSLNTLFSSSITLGIIILPLAISFFTFQQIAYLVDTYKGEKHNHNFLNYALFVTFFPQLIAGPIVHHREMMPQFARKAFKGLNIKHLAVGITIFIIGLFKKVVLADGLSRYSLNVFNAVEQGMAMTFFESWGGALSYTLQIYFDFSGYSDMAIGMARMFGIRLPLNFNSPYKATSIIDFWRRWHITLSRFLRDYVYIPLGGNRIGGVRNIYSLMSTMLLGGLWHGAAWTFLLWGGLHGIYLLINHRWRNLKRSAASATIGKVLGWVTTMLCIVFSWVLFRAESIEGAGNLLAGMVGLHGFVLPTEYLGYLNHLAGLGNYLVKIGFEFNTDHVLFFYGFFQFLAILIGFAVVVFLPNTQQIMRRYRPAFETYQGEVSRLPLRWQEWRPTLPFALFIISLLAMSIMGLTRVSEFIYFQF